MSTKNEELIERARYKCGAFDQLHRELADALEVASARLTMLDVDHTPEGRATVIALGDWLHKHYPTTEHDIAKHAMAILVDLHANAHQSRAPREEGSDG